VSSGDTAVIVYRLGSLGDTVVSLPCFRAIRASYPDARIVVLTNLPISAVAAPLQQVLPPGMIDGAIAYPVGARSLGEFLRIRREIRALGARTLIFLGGGRGLLRVYRDCLFFWLCGIKRIIGAPLRADLESPRLGRDGAEEYEAERLARCLASLAPIELDDPGAWDLALTPNELDAADTALAALPTDRFIVLNTGGKLQVQDWGEANWATLLSALSDDLSSLGLVFVGGEEDRAVADRLGRLWKGPVLSLCGRLTPRESAAVLRRALLFIGHDTGPLHLAAAVQTPTVSVFGSNNRPRRWHPLWPAAHRLPRCQGSGTHRPRRGDRRRLLRAPEGRRGRADAQPLTHDHDGFRRRPRTVSATDGFGG
jgi:heptosyltransferase-3